MHSAKYLYDTDMNEFAEYPYVDVLLIKIDLATELMRKLVLKDNMIDNQRMSEVSKAISFNRELLKELGFRDPDISKMLEKLKEIKEK
jgi:mevalonate kinase